MLLSKNWEVLSLTVKKEFDFNGIEKPVAVVFCNRSGNVYTPLVMGVDYSYHKEYKTYRQVLYQLVMRGKALGCTQINLGFSASVEKKKVGAVSLPVSAYMQAKDNYNFQVLANMALNGRG